MSSWLEWIAEEIEEQNMSLELNTVGGVPQYDPKIDPDAFMANLSRRRSKFTPDYFQRKMEDHIPMFVYGAMKKGGFLYDDIMDSCYYLGSGTTSQGHWDLRTEENGYYPIMMKSFQGEDAFLGKVRGQVFVVDPLTLLQVDRMEQNGVLFKRQKIFIALHDQKYTTKDGLRATIIPCWTYVGLPEASSGKTRRCPYEKIGDGKYLNFPVGGHYRA